MKGNKRKVIIITLVAVLIVAAAAISYAIWSKTFTETGVNKNTYACFEVTYNEPNGGGVTMGDAFPQTDEEGMQNDPYDIEIKNICNTIVPYNVILNKKEGSTLDNSHLKVAVDSISQLLSDAKPVDKKVIDDYSVAESRLIGTGLVLAGQTKTIHIRHWMDENTSEQDGTDKSFAYKITIEAIGENGNLLSRKILADNRLIETQPNFEWPEPVAIASQDQTGGSGLYMALDDDGDSYYFRGKIDNNYVKFAEKTWRIVRINGDGTIRLILNNNNEDPSVTQFNTYSDNEEYEGMGGYTYSNTKPCTNDNPCISDFVNESFKNSEGIGEDSNIKTELEKWYQSNLAQYNDKIALTTYCNDTSYKMWDSERKNYNDGDYKEYQYIYYSKDKAISLKCLDPIYQKENEILDYGGVYKLKIGLINGDELSMAGLSWEAPYKNSDNNNNNYLYIGNDFWTMTPSQYSYYYYSCYDDETVQMKEWIFIWI